MVKSDDKKKKNLKDTKKKAKEEKNRTKKVSKELKKISNNNVETSEKKKTIYIFETVVVVLLAIIMLLLLCNRTFFREKYTTDKIDIDIPLLTFYVKDSNGEIVFKTLRKSEYVRHYFDLYLSNLTKYNCGDNSFYYDELKHVAIYDISVEKKFAVKTIKIKYTNGDADCLCDSKINC